MDVTHNQSSNQDLLCCRACLASGCRLYNIHENKLADALSRISGSLVRPLPRGRLTRTKHPVRVRAFICVQAHKKALSDTVVDQNEESLRHFTSEDLKDLFRLEENTLSDTHSKFKCRRCVNNIQVTLPPENSDCTSDLSNWYHCADKKNLADLVLKQCWDLAKSISFVFHHRSAKTEAQNETEDKENVQEKKRRKIEIDEDYSEPDDSADEDYA